MKLKTYLLCTVLMAIGIPGILAAAELEENSWSNPEFVKRFLGSYGFDSAITPKISSDEQKLFKELVPLMSSNPEQAIESLKAAITEESSAALEYTLGNLYFQNQRQDEAIAAYKAAIRKFPDFYRAHKNLGMLYIQKDDYKVALPAVIKAISLKSGDGTLYGLLGLCHLKRESYSLALQAYGNAMMLDPDSMDWKKGKLACLMGLQRYDEASAMLSTMLDEDPMKEDLWLMQANALIGLGEVDAAIVNIEVVKAMDGASPASIMLLADMYMNKDMPEEAVMNYMEVIDSGDYSVSRLLRVMDVLVSTGYTGEASRLIEKVEEPSSLSPEELKRILGVKAKIAMLSGDDAEATAILEDLIAQDPLNGSAHLLLGDLYVKQGMKEKAVFEYTYAAKDKEVRPQSLIQHARLCVSLQDYTTAAKLLREYLNLDYRQNVADFLAQVERAGRAQASL